MVEPNNLVNASESLQGFNSPQSQLQPKLPPQPINEDLQKLLEILPPELYTAITHHPQRDKLVEVVMDLGRLPEVRFPQGAEYLSETPVSSEQLNYCLQRVGTFSGDNRAGIERTLHRISAIRNRTGAVIGLTCRVGRAVFGTIAMIRDLVETGQSILMLGRPGVGKTTALREVARVLADDLGKRVVIIDTSNEIAGDGDVPHPAIGRARRMQVARPELQHQVMIEAVENHMPEVIVIDEIGTELEALAARTIAERGVQLVGTAHGNRLENLMKNPTLSDLVGGIQAVTLGDDEARRRGSQKTVLERKAPPTFAIAIEMLERQRWIIHENVADSMDQLLRSKEPNPEVRTVNQAGEVVISREFIDRPVPPRVPLGMERGSDRPYDRPDERLGERGFDSFDSSRRDSSTVYPLKPTGWRTTGQMTPISEARIGRKEFEAEKPEPDFAQLLDQSWQDDNLIHLGFTANGEDLPLHVYPYGVSRQQLEQVIQVLNLPVILTKDMENADVILALRSNLKHQSKLRPIARARHIPIHTLKAGTIPQITKALRRLLDMDDPAMPETTDVRLFAPSGAEDEIEALEEARLAVEQIVIPKGQPVELLPRSAKVRKMQHELVEHYRLKSNSFGDEPNRRLRIYPA
ncbi:MAG: AAA family ATPase [Coleofasciculaceae cyanobacterium SM2_1_6]|nr:AAA family ATPase [Coleofasciculaceae cyanobacterium SM2_1_6]